MIEPTTVAGKQFANLLNSMAWEDAADHCRDWICAIEAEAREQGISDVIDRAEFDIRRAERARIAEAVAPLRGKFLRQCYEEDGRWYSRVAGDYVAEVLAAVLALLEQKPCAE